MPRAFCFVLVMLALVAPPANAQAPTSALYYNNSYSPRADPYRDLELALERASAENKRVLIIVGGEWCTWCEVLDRAITGDAEVSEAFAETFLILKVNWSSQNRNETFLSGFPPSGGFPDLFVLDSNGRYLGRQRTNALEAGWSYDRERLIAFARRWRVQ